MRRLLAANFFRLRKSGLFWGLLAFCLGAGALMAFQLYQMNQYEYFPLDGAFFTYPIFVCVIIAVFIPQFFGRDYSDHTVRNKVAAGHPRATIYAANLLTGTAVPLLLCVAYMAVVAAIGIPLVGPVSMDAGQAALMVLGSLVAMAACSALSTFVSMACTSKSISAVVCILGVFLLLIASIYLRSRLDAPEFYTDYFVNEAGEVVWGDLVENPQCLSGTQRAVYEFFYNLLPPSQAIQYASRETQNLWQMPLYSLLVILLSTGAGIVLFRKKDLK